MGDLTTIIERNGLVNRKSREKSPVGAVFKVNT